MKGLNGRFKKLQKPFFKLPQTSSQSQLEPSKLCLVPAKYQKGDLINLNAFGTILLVEHNVARVGIIMSGPRNFHYVDQGKDVMYWVYDVFVGNELVTDVPQDFMAKVSVYEEDTQ